MASERRGYDTNNPSTNWNGAEKPLHFFNNICTRMKSSPASLKGQHSWDRSAR